MKIHVETRELSCGIGPGATNVYFLLNIETRQMILIDPAGEAERIKQTVAELGGRPTAILLTHAHFDHLVAMGEIRDAYDAPIYCGAGDRELLAFFMEELAAVPGFVPADADVWVRGGEELALAGLSMQVLATPGHSKGSVCYFFPEEGILFSGDTLFRESVGRTDFPVRELQGDHEALMRGVRALVGELPGETRVYPGHGPATTIEHERVHNPFLQTYGGE